jgi:PAS domain-containing protein
MYKELLRINNDSIVAAGLQNHVHHVRMLSSYCDSHKVNMFIFKALDPMENSDESRFELRLVFCNNFLQKYYSDHGFPNPVGKTLRELSPFIYMVYLNGESIPEIYHRVSTKGGSERFEEVQFFRDVPTAYSRNFYTVTIMNLASGFSVVCVDERTTQVLAQVNQHYFSSLLESTPDLCVISDIESYAVQYINKAGIKLAKISDAVLRDLLNLKMTELVPHLRAQFETFKENAEAKIKDTRPQQEQIWSGRTTLVALDGEKIEVDASVVFMKGEDSISYIAVLARDLRSKLKSEAELNEARRANEAKSSFLSSTLRRPRK